MRRPHFMLVPVITILACAATAQPPMIKYHRTRPRARQGIPAADYQHGNTSQVTTKVSRSALLLQADQELLTELRAGIAAGSDLTELVENAEKFKLFQLDIPKMELDHCAISQVALLIAQDGTWILSLLAEQNAPLLSLPEQPGPYTQTAFIKRNEFVVTLRCQGAHRSSPQADPAIGKPVLAVLGPLEFMVHQGQPHYLRVSNDEMLKVEPGSCYCCQYRMSQRERALLQRYFAYIDRVEVEFFYRGASLDLKQD